MWSYVVLFVLACINPFGGMFVSMPIALYKLEWPPWFACALGIPLAYVQVVVVDVLWERLMAWPWWVRLIEKRKSEKLTDLLARDNAKIYLAIFGVWAGPWLVMAVARFAGHTRGRVALPLLFGITYVTIGVAAVYKLAPQLLD
jgi:hypothetical protein